MSNEIQTIADQNEIISLQKRQLEAMANGGFLPKGCTTAEAFARVVAGGQMGLKPIQALNGIAMINGHPTLHSDTIPCVVMASGLVCGMKYKFEGEGDDMSCTFSIRRKGIDEWQEWTYSVADAKQAGVMNNPVWKTHTKKMLFNRARTWCMRNTFPDVIGNIYSDDEARELEPAPAPKQKALEEDLNKYQAVSLDIAEEPLQEKKQPEPARTTLPFQEDLDLSVEEALE